MNRIQQRIWPSTLSTRPPGMHRTILRSTCNRVEGHNTFHIVSSVNFSALENLVKRPAAMPVKIGCGFRRIRKKIRRNRRKTMSSFSIGGKRNARQNFVQFSTTMKPTPTLKPASMTPFGHCCAKGRLQRQNFAPDHENHMRDMNFVSSSTPPRALQSPVLARNKKNWGDAAKMSRSKNLSNSHASATARVAPRHAKRAMLPRWTTDPPIHFLSPTSPAIADHSTKSLPKQLPRATMVHHANKFQDQTLFLSLGTCLWTPSARSRTLFGAGARLRCCGTKKPGLLRFHQVKVTRHKRTHLHMTSSDVETELRKVQKASITHSQRSRNGGFLDKSGLVKETCGVTRW